MGLLDLFGEKGYVIKCEWSFDLVRDRDRMPSSDIFVISSTLIPSGGWWHKISTFFLILFEGKRRRGEFKIGLIVLVKLKPRGAFHHAAFVFALSSQWMSWSLCSWCYWRKWGCCVSLNQGWTKENKLLGSVAFRILSRIYNGAPPWNSQRPQQVHYICKKDPITDAWLDSKCIPDCRCCKCGV